MIPVHLILHEVMDLRVLQKVIYEVNTAYFSKLETLKSKLFVTFQIPKYLVKSLQKNNGETEKKNWDS